MSDWIIRLFLVVFALPPMAIALGALSLVLRDPLQPTYRKDS